MICLFVYLDKYLNNKNNMQTFSIFFCVKCFKKSTAGYIKKITFAALNIYYE